MRRAALGSDPPPRSTSEASRPNPVGASNALGDDAHEEPQSAVLTVDELAKVLRVDRKTVYNLIARGELPGVRRLGRAVRIHRDAVLGWLAQGQGHVSRSRSHR
jgi:excisionase family DNA binding protein